MIRKPSKPGPAERPILFKDAMVAAILDGRKDVTRRVGPTWAGVQPGTRLWVRECHAILHACCWPDLPHRRGTERRMIITPEGHDRTVDSPLWAFYRTGFDRSAPRWRPSIHMPRWACRLELEVVSVTEEHGNSGMLWLHPKSAKSPIGDAEAQREGFASRTEFEQLWFTMHAKHVGPVYRVEFRRVLP